MTAIPVKATEKCKLNPYFGWVYILKSLKQQTTWGLKSVWLNIILKFSLMTFTFPSGESHLQEITNHRWME